MTAYPQDQRYGRRRMECERTIAYARRKWPTIGKLGDHPLTYAIALDLNKRNWRAWLATGVSVLLPVSFVAAVAVIVLLLEDADWWKQILTPLLFICTALPIAGMLERRVGRYSDFSLAARLKQGGKQFLFDLWLTPMTVAEMASITAMVNLCAYKRLNRWLWVLFTVVAVSFAVWVLEKFNVPPRYGLRYLCVVLGVVAAWASAALHIDDSLVRISIRWFFGNMPAPPKLTRTQPIKRGMIIAAIFWAVLACAAYVALREFILSGMIELGTMACYVFAAPLFVFAAVAWRSWAGGGARRKTEDYIKAKEGKRQLAYEDLVDSLAGRHGLRQ